MSDIDPVEFGRLQATCDQLEIDVRELKGDMKTLLAMANRGKGALYASMSMAGLIGGLATWIVERLLR